MAPMPQHVELPVRLAIGEHTLDLGSIELPVKLGPVVRGDEGLAARLLLDGDALNAEVADLLEQAARALREGGDDDDAASSTG